MSHSGWWTIHAEDLFKFLERAHAGENPELLYLEMYANSKVEQP